ncbi:MAG: hypothetical protein AB1631_08785 [Acidobacteriota bacterium]
MAEATGAASVIANTERSDRQTVVIKRKGMRQRGLRHPFWFFLPSFPVISYNRRMKILRRFLLISALLCVLFAICYVALYVKSSSAEREVERAWAATFIDLQSLPSRFPQTDKNATAILMEDMFKDGGKLGMRGTECLPPWKGEWKIMGMEGRIPEDVRSYLEAHQSDLLMIYGRIREEAPQWEMDIEKLSACPSPNFLRQRAISQLFLLDAINKSQQGRSKEAAEAMEAAWIANSSLRRRPELITQVISMSIDRAIARVSPEIKGLPDEWQKRFTEPDYRESIQTAFAHEAWVHLQMARVYSNMTGLAGSALESRLGKLATTMGRPYFRMCAVNSAEAIRQSLIEYRKQKEHPDNFDIETINKLMRDSLADWNYQKNWNVISSPGGLGKMANEVMTELEETAKAIGSRKK